MSTMDAQATGDAAAIFPAPNGELQEEEDAVEQPKEPSKRRRNKKKRSGRAAPSSAADEASQLLRDPSGILQVVMTPDCGRGVVAVVPVAAGTTVLSERAAAAVCFATTAHAHCAHCLRAGVVTKCADCDAVAFCSSECAATHAALHANECRVLAALPSVAQECGVDPTLLRLVLRCIVRRHMESESGADRDAGSAESAAPSGCRIATQADVRLLHDTGEAEAAAEWRESVCKGLAVMQDLLPPALAVPPPEAERLARMINLNCHGLKDQQGRNTDVGVGLFPMVAMMNHSCRPNCVFVPAAHLPGTLEVRTTMKVAAGDALTVSYIDTYQPRADRRRELQHTKHFLCRCPRCDHPSEVDAEVEGMCCVRCGAPEPMRPPRGDSALPATCTHCGAPAPAAATDALLRGMTTAAQRAQQLMSARRYSEARALLERALQTHQQEGVGGVRLHVRHAAVLNAHAALLNCCNFEQDSVAAARHARYVLSCLEALSPAASPEKGDFHAALADALQAALSKPRLPPRTAQAMRTELKQALLKCWNCRRICLGGVHPSTREAHAKLQACR